jgi:type II secretory pathway pseudopilin PulG
MNEHSLVLLTCLVVIVVLATLLYAAGWGYLAALAKVGELSAMLSQILAHTHNMDQSLRQQRRVLYDAHKRISAVTKGVRKPAL